MTTFVAAESVNMTSLFHYPWIRPGAVSSFEPRAGVATQVAFDNPVGDDVRLEGHFTIADGAVSGGRVDSVSLVTPEGEAVATIGFESSRELGEVLPQLQVHNGVASLFAGDDAIKGSNGPDRLHGLDGADTILGGRGDDFLQGGDGADVLRGGGGADQFEYLAVSESSVDAPDMILGFHGHGGDMIDLSQLDANLAAPGDQAFTYGGEAFDGVAGELTIQRLPGVYRVEGDVDGDGLADIQILVMAGGSLTTADFFL